VPRDRYYISSKVGTHPDHPGDYSAGTARWTVDNSLRVLGVDYLDLCHLHDPEPHHLDQALAPGGSLEALVQLKEEGVIKSIGIGVQDHELHRRSIDTGVLDVAMMVNDCTLMRQKFADVAELAGKHGVGLVNGAPLAMGLLSGRDPDTIGTPKWTPPADEVKGAKRVHQWCGERGIPVLALALQFAVRQNAFDCTLVGSANPAEVEGCWSALAFPIPQEVWDELPALLAELRIP
jgi:aryl-alcohol dehydrogenase-like predicted oxidoreductase